MKFLKNKKARRILIFLLALAGMIYIAAISNVQELVRELKEEAFIFFLLICLRLCEEVVWLPFVETVLDIEKKSDKKREA